MEVSVGDWPAEGPLLSTAGAYFIAGREGFTDQSTMIDESYQAQIYSSGRVEELSDPGDRDRCWMSSGHRALPDVDIGPRIPVVVADDELWARREVYDVFGEEVIEYFGVRDPWRMQYSAGESVAILGLAAGVVPEPVQLGEPWGWASRRSALFDHRRISLSWSPDGDSQTYIGFTVEVVDDFELEADATSYFVRCSLVDDGGAVVIDIPDLLTASMYVVGANVFRMRDTWHDDPVLGAARFTVGTNTLLDGDPLPVSAAALAATDHAANVVPPVFPSLSGSTPPISWRRGDR